MSLHVTIDTDNAAFDDPDELGHVLARLVEIIGNDPGTTGAELAQRHDERGTVRDTNGNTVGRWAINPVGDEF